MLLIEINYQEEKSKKEETFIFGNISFKIGDIIKIDFNKLIVNNILGINDFLKFKEKIYSKAKIEDSHLIKINVPYFQNQKNEDNFYENKYYVLKWDDGDSMFISEYELGKFIKDI